MGGLNSKGEINLPLVKKKGYCKLAKEEKYGVGTIHENKEYRAKNAEKAKQYLRDLNYLPEEIIQLIK